MEIKIEAEVLVKAIGEFTAKQVKEFEMTMKCLGAISKTLDKVVDVGLKLAEAEARRSEIRFQQQIEQHAVEMREAQDRKRERDLDAAERAAERAVCAKEREIRNAVLDDKLASISKTAKAE